MTKFKRQFDPRKKLKSGLTTTLPSQCIPDMNIGIKQLLINHTRGLITEKAGIYSNTEIPIFDDITDKMSYLEDIKTQAKEIGKQIKKEQLEQKNIEKQKIKDEIILQNAKKDTIPPTTSPPDKL